MNVGNPSCPVHSFLKYLDKRNDDITALWQRPLASFFPDSETWYCKAPLGKNTLGKMMSEISRQGQLSQRYTNHSVRSTAITVLDEAGERYFIFYDDTYQLFNSKVNTTPFSWSTSLH